MSQGTDEEAPERPAIIDCELVVPPNFYKLLASRADASELCLWAFDLLHLNGADLRDEPLAKRRAKLECLHECPAVLFSGASLTHSVSSPHAKSDRSKAS